MTPLITQFGNTLPPRGQPSARWSWLLTQSSFAASCPMMFNNLYSLQHVGTNFAQNSRCTGYQRKRASAHQGMDVSPQHVPETCPGNMSPQSVRFCPCYILQQHVPETCPGNTSPLLIVYLTRFSPLYICSNLTTRMGSPKASREQILLEFILSAYKQRWKQSVTRMPPFFLLIPGRNFMVNALYTLILQK